jgi:hypothetical protein
VIQVYIPNQFGPERRYIVKTLLEDFLGLEITIEYHRLPHYRLVLENRREIVIRDHFFSRFSDDAGPEYVSADNIPGQALWLNNPLAVENPLPVIFGDDGWNVEPERLECGIDLFASAFFMLSRWEEYALRDDSRSFDSHGRFPATASLAFRQGFIDRPLVNEYVELLWRMLETMGIRQERRMRRFSFVLTHDVDALVMWRGWGHALKTAAADVVKRLSPNTAVRRLRDYGNIVRGTTADPFDTFSQLMDIAERLNLTSHFYFKCGGDTQFDRVNPYNIAGPKGRSVLESIRRRNHTIGFHPSYQAAGDPQVWRQELELLRDVAGGEVLEGRQHYLKFKVPDTWRVWDENGMWLDSTLGFADREGFRCGTGDPYQVFDIVRRHPLELLERPLVFMERRNYSCGGFEGELEEHRMPSIVAAARKVNTHVTLLFHNDAMADPLFQRMYRRILSL